MFALNNVLIKRPLAFIVAVLFSAQTALPAAVLGQALPRLDIAASPVMPLAAFQPAVLKGLRVSPDKPFAFDFIVEEGNTARSAAGLRIEAGKLIKDFVVALAIPEKDLWVNLSPYEPDRIMPAAFAATAMGRNLLEQDAVLKRLAASLTHPDTTLGREFWRRVYARVREKYGTVDVPLDALTKVWIAPDKAVVYEKPTQGPASDESKIVYVSEASLKVLLEKDYVALARQGTGSAGELLASSAPANDSISEEVAREVLLPELNREVNEGAQFAGLRQVYNAVILAAWYKARLKASLLGQGFANKGQIAPSQAASPQARERIYQEYLSVFRKGVYSLIREEADPDTGEMIPRKYFSGGVSLEVEPEVTARLPGIGTRRHSVVSGFMKGPDHAEVNSQSMDWPKAEYGPALRLAGGAGLLSAGGKFMAMVEPRPASEECLVHVQGTDPGAKETWVRSSQLITMAAVSDDGKYLVTVSNFSNWNSVVLLWARSGNGGFVPVIRDNEMGVDITSRIVHAEWSVKNELMLVTADRRFMVLDQKGSQLWENQLAPTAKPVAHFIHEGLLVSAIMPDGKLTFFNGSTGEKMDAISAGGSSYVYTPPGFDDSYSDEARVQGGELKWFWMQDKKWQNIQFSHPAEVISIKFSDKADHLLTLDANGTVRIFQKGKGLVKEFPVDPGTTNAFFWPGTNHIVAGFTRESGKIYAPMSLAATPSEISGKGRVDWEKVSANYFPLLNENIDLEVTLALSPLLDGTAATYPWGQRSLMVVPTSQPGVEIFFPENINSVVFIGNSGKLAVGFESGHVQLLDVATLPKSGEYAMELPAMPPGLAPGQKSTPARVFTGQNADNYMVNRNGRLEFWSVAAGEMFEVVPISNGATVKAAAMSLDGRRVAFLNSNRDVILMEIASGKILMMQNNVAAIEGAVDLMFSPGGQEVLVFVPQVEELKAVVFDPSLPRESGQIAADFRMSPDIPKKVIGTSFSSGTKVAWLDLPQKLVVVPPSAAPELVTGSIADALKNGGYLAAFAQYILPGGSNVPMPPGGIDLTPAKAPSNPKGAGGQKQAQGNFYAGMINGMNNVLGFSPLDLIKSLKEMGEQVEITGFAPSIPGADHLQVVLVSMSQNTPVTPLIGGLASPSLASGNGYNFIGSILPVIEATGPAGAPDRTVMEIDPLGFSPVRYEVLTQDIPQPNPQVIKMRTLSRRFIRLNNDLLSLLGKGSSAEEVKTFFAKLREFVQVYLVLCKAGVMGDGYGINNHPQGLPDLELVAADSGDLEGGRASARIYLRLYKQFMGGDRPRIARESSSVIFQELALVNVVQKDKTTTLIGQPFETTEQKSPAVLDGITAHELINILHQKANRNMAAIYARMNVKRHVARIAAWSAQGGKEWGIHYLDGRQNPDKPVAGAMLVLARALARNQFMHPADPPFPFDSSNTSVVSISADDVSAEAAFTLGLHSAEVAFDLRPFSQGGMIQIGYTDSGNAYKPGSSIRFEALIQAFTAFGFKVTRAAEVMHFDAVIDKENAAGVRSAGELIARLESAIQVLMYSKDLDLWSMGWTAADWSNMMRFIQETRVNPLAVLGARDILNGLSPLRLLTDDDRDLFPVFSAFQFGALKNLLNKIFVARPGQNLADLQQRLAEFMTANGYLDRNAVRLGAEAGAVKSWEALTVEAERLHIPLALPNGQRRLDAFQAELAKRLASGAIIVENGALQVNSAYTEAESGVSRVQALLTHLEQANAQEREEGARIALLADLLAPLMAERPEAAVVGGYAMTRERFTWLGEDITFFVLRDANGRAVFAEAVMGEFYFARPRFDPWRLRQLPDNRLGFNDLVEILRSRDISIQDEFSARFTPGSLNAGGEETVDYYERLRQVPVTDLGVIDEQVFLQPALVGSVAVGPVALNGQVNVAASAFGLAVDIAEPDPGKFAGAIILSNSIDTRNDALLAEVARTGGALLMTGGGSNSHGSICARQLKLASGIMPLATYDGRGLHFAAPSAERARTTVNFAGRDLVAYESAGHSRTTQVISQGDLVYYDGHQAAAYLVARAEDSKTQAAFKAYSEWRSDSTLEGRGRRLAEILQSSEAPGFLRAALSDVMDHERLTPDEFNQMMGVLQGAATGQFQILQEFLAHIVNNVAGQYREVVTQVKQQLQDDKEGVLPANELALLAYRIETVWQRLTDLVTLANGGVADPQAVLAPARAERSGIFQELSKRVEKERLLVSNEARKAEARAQELLDQKFYGDAGNERRLNPEDALYLRRLEKLQERIDIMGIDGPREFPSLTKIAALLNARYRVLNAGLARDGIIWKQDVSDPGIRDLIGGKGAHSAELYRLINAINGHDGAVPQSFLQGLRVAVPPGFFITTAEYQNWLADGQGEFRPEFKKALETAYLDLFVSQGAEIVAFIENDNDTPEDSRVVIKLLDLKERVKNADVDRRMISRLINFRRLMLESSQEITPALKLRLEGWGRVAVRSSGLVEDSQANAAAGKFKTVVNVIGLWPYEEVNVERFPEDQRQAIIASLSLRGWVNTQSNKVFVDQDFLDLDEEFRREFPGLTRDQLNDIQTALEEAQGLYAAVKRVWRSGAEGVEVDGMIAGARSAVIITADVARHTLRRVKIDGAHGAAGPLVSSRIQDPDTYYVDALSGVTQERHVGAQIVDGKARDGNGEPVFTERERAVMAALAVIINRNMGYIASDQEALMDAEGLLYYLQTRPETTLRAKVKAGLAVLSRNDYAAGSTTDAAVADSQNVRTVRQPVDNAARRTDQLGGITLDPRFMNDAARGPVAQGNGAAGIKRANLLPGSGPNFAGGLVPQITAVQHISSRDLTRLLSGR
ncbi:MAG: hypothetical protein HQL20_04665 [Candidatus Omnitrophica bacterium]|nr:hypothetical protein [Candidatus Omnitrophota bacterium]